MCCTLRDIVSGNGIPLARIVTRPEISLAPASTPEPESEVETVGRIDHPNESDHIRRNPQDAQGKTRGSFPSDLVGDEMEQADNWRELVAQEHGYGDDDEAMDDVGNAQSSILAGTGDLDHLHGSQKSRMRQVQAEAEDNPDLINPNATARRDSGQP
jgi:hypothetical protein